MKARVRMATEAGLVLCEECGKVLSFVSSPAGHNVFCPRCRARLHRRKPNSLSRTWALVIAALIMYVPANVYPIMTVIRFGRGSPSTIVQGVKILFAEGMYGIALLVFFASVVVPLMKLFGLMFLLLSVRYRWDIPPLDRTRLYRVLDSVGRWSMLDIFVIAILVALVRLGSVAEITAGPAATSFAAVVVITMLAAESFDPRLIWDAQGETGNE